MADAMNGRPDPDPDCGNPPQADKLRIWVDADACPGPIKDILFRAADRRGIDTTLVANRSLHVPHSPHLSFVQVDAGLDVADGFIVNKVRPKDLVITADVPLAAEVIEAGGNALNPRGTLFTRENIQDHLARRNFLDELRGAGTMTGGQAPLTKSDVQQFANQLDRYLTRNA